MLGPLQSGAETRGHLGCAIDGAGREPVVLVFLPDELAHDAKRFSRVLRETAFVKKLDHPGILKVHGIERYEEGWTRITGFADGEPLGYLLERAAEADRSPSPALAARIVVDLAEAVSHAHEVGSATIGRPIVHGGIRPDTVLVGFDGHVVLSGFGAASLAPATAHGGDRHAWAAYLAPEQIIGGKTTTSAASDVYALGALLYFLLTGKRPFADVEDLDSAAMTQPPPTVDGEGLVGALGAIVSQCMAKRGGERPGSAAELAEAIRKAVDDAGETLPGDDAVAELVGPLVPESAAERQGRAVLLSMDASDLSPLESLGPSEDVDPELFEAARPEAPRVAPSRANTEIDPGLANGSASPIPVGMEEAEPTRAGPPQAARPQMPAAPVPQVPMPPAPMPPVPQSGWQSQQPPLPQSGWQPQQVPVPQSGWQAPQVGPQSGWQTPLAQVPTAWPTVGPQGGPPPNAGWGAQPGAMPHPSQDLARNPAGYPPSTRDMPPQGQPPMGAPPAPEAWPRSGMQAPMSNGPHTGRSYLADAQAEAAAGRVDLLQNQPVHNLPSSPAPRVEGARTESRITSFNLRAGDGSRSLLYIVLVAAVGLLAFVMLAPTDVPEGLDEPVKENRVDRALVQEVLAEADRRKAAEEEEGAREAAEATEETSEGSAAEGAEAAVEDTATEGSLVVRTVPKLDVYLGDERLGRSPLTVTVPTGKQTIRLTDRETGVNLYRVVKVGGNAPARIAFELETSQLTVNAPDGARIYLNGRFIAEAPMKEPAQIYEGRYLLKVTFDGMRWTDRFEADAGRKISFDVTLNE